jgi:hypothetical protein
VQEIDRRWPTLAYRGRAATWCGGAGDGAALTLVKTAAAGIGLNAVNLFDKEWDK